MPSDDWTTGYRAGLEYAWSHPGHRGGLRATMSDQEPDAPEGSTPEFLDGWRQGVRGRH